MAGNQIIFAHQPMQLAYLSLGVLAFFTLWQLYFHFRYFIKLASYKGGRKNEAPGHEPVSIIVVARNEFANLEANLPLLLDQDYPDYEVIVVNNGSWDKSQELLEEMEEQHARLKVVKIVEQERYPKGKKFGLTLGIKAAGNEWLLLTDSDCKPVGRNWIRSMSANFVENKEICLGYSPYEKKPDFLNILIRFDAFFTALQYLSFALAGKPYMGVGRNLAYRKSLFFRVKGFATHNHILSGDDDLFINETATSKNTRICIHPDSFMVTTPKESWEDWIKQKKRHLGVGKYYSASSKSRLAGLHASAVLFYVSLAAAIYFCFPHKENLFFLIPLWIYLARLISQFFVYGFAMKRLKETNLIYFLPLLDLYFMFFYFFMGVGATFSRPRKNVW